MKFVGIYVKALPFPHFHDPTSHPLLASIYHPFFIQLLTQPLLREIPGKHEHNSNIKKLFFQASKLDINVFL